MPQQHQSVLPRWLPNFCRLTAAPHLLTPLPVHCAMADASAGAAAASAAAAPPRAAAAAPRAAVKPPFAKVFVDEFARAHDSTWRGSTTRAAALDAGALEALVAAPWQLLLIVGETASGKTLALTQLSAALGLRPDLSADFEFARDRAVVSHFGSPDAAVLRLGLVGACARRSAASCVTCAARGNRPSRFAHVSWRKYRPLSCATPRERCSLAAL